MNDDTLEKLLTENVIVIYDGICGFCNASIQFILNNRPSKILKFVSFQSEIGQRILLKLQLQISLDSIVVIENKKHYLKSEAFLKIMKYLDSKFKYIYYLNVIPLWISDFCYNIISKNRYLLMGRVSTCRFIIPKEKDFFLNDFEG